MTQTEIRVELFPQPWVKWIYMPNLASVVTSVTIVETTDEEARQRYQLLFSLRISSLLHFPLQI